MSSADHPSVQLSDALRAVLREARKSAQISLGELARRAGLNRQAISFIENGERRPTTETLIRIALALRIKPSELWARAEAMMPSAWMNLPHTH